MSKKRPRTRTPRWERRVFQNTYTHNGRLVKVKGWSVKIQHEGHRRTLSLNSLKRADAAREAEQLYKKIISRGWSAVTPAAAGSGAASAKAGEHSETATVEKADVGYWESRLLQRRYPVRAEGAAVEWSVYLEHEGLGNYFPLGTVDTHAAAARALTIHKTIVDHGWEAAYRQFPREVTVAFHWVINPVTWTYTTFHTEVEARPTQPMRGPEPVLRVALIEPDAGIRQALQRWLAACEGVRCVAAYAAPDDALKQATPGRKELWLVNRTLPGMAGNECLDRLRRSVAGLCGLIYSVYEDSNQLFLATPGGAMAYLLKRTPPDRLLEAVMTTDRCPASPAEVLSRVRQYYAPCLDFAPPDEQVRALENVTPREYEILELLSRGHVDKEIAARLGISGWTVRGHLKNIFEKLKVHTRTEAVVKFLHK